MPAKASVKRPDSMFTGDVCFDEIAKGGRTVPYPRSLSEIRAKRPRPAIHYRRTTLYITEGIGLVQSRGRRYYGCPGR